MENKKTFKKICIECGEEFDCKKKHPHTKTCSRTCLSSHMKRVKLESWEGNKIIRIKNCEICNEEFDYGNHPETKTCSKECLLKLVNDEEYIEKKVETMIKTNNERHGVDFTSQMDEHKDKVTKTWENKPEEEKEDIMNRRVETHNNKPEEEKQKIKDKRAETKETKYGDPTFNNSEKSKVTNMERFNSLFYLGSDEHIKLVRQKTIDELNEILKMNDLEFDSTNFTTRRVPQTQKVIYYNVKCLKCGTTFETSLVSGKFNDNTQEDGSITICRKCYPIHSSSKIQRDFILFLDTLGVKYEEGVRNLISPFEIDIYLPDYNLGVELNGNYWHSFLGGGI